MCTNARMCQSCDEYNNYEEVCYLYLANNKSFQGILSNLTYTSIIRPRQCVCTLVKNTFESGPNLRYKQVN